MNTLKKRSSRDSWAEQRDRFRHQKDTIAYHDATVEAAASEVKKIIDSAEMLTRHAAMSRSLQGLAATWLQTLKMDGNPQRYDPDKVAKLKAGEVATLLKLGFDSERLTEGLSTERTEVVDISAMSDADLEKLANGGTA